MSLTERQLYRWVKGQRVLYNKGLMSPDRVKLLEKIPGWEWQMRVPRLPAEEAWERGFKYLNEHGADVIRKFRTSDGYKLGIWINNQRYSCKDPVLRKRLESVPGWEWTLGKGPRKAKLSKV